MINREYETGLNRLVVVGGVWYVALQMLFIIWDFVSTGVKMLL